jgi:hypothetical protein
MAAQNNQRFAYSRIPRRPLWQTLIIYMLVAGFIYLVIYFLFISPNPNLCTGSFCYPSPNEFY